MVRRLVSMVLLVAAMLGYQSIALASPGSDLTTANEIVVKALGQAQKGDLTGAKATYAQFRERWLDIEDGVKDQSKTAYRTIESAMSDVQFAFLQSPPDAAKVSTSLTALRDTNQRFIDGGFPADGAKAGAPAGNSGTSTAPPTNTGTTTPPANTGNTTAPAANTGTSTDPASSTAPANTGTSTAPATGTAAPVTGGPKAASGPVADMTAANEYVIKAVALAQQGDLNGARASFEQFRQRWTDIEDGIRAQSKAHYAAIEAEMGDSRVALQQSPPNQSVVIAELSALRQANQHFINGDPPPKTEDSKNESSDVAALLGLLDQAKARAEAKDAAGAAQAMDQFRKQWLSVEGVVLTQSAKVYGDAERDMVNAYAQLTANPPDLQGAIKTIDQMRAYLAPIAGKTAYSAFDAATILLREGLEAVLILVALLGFLRKAGHADKSGWIWAGVGGGLVVSAVLAVLVKLLFGTGAFGNNNFLIAGWTGIFAAVMLIYVSYWLHSKSSISEWNRYIKEKSTAALATGSLMSLATLSFLSVFREGTETVLFFIGMASSISTSDLLLGLGLGFAILAVLAFVILKVGVKIPIRPFFLVSSILVFYLGFKFTGMGIHGLQLAGKLPSNMASYLPSIDWLALYPNWQSTLPQLALLLLALGMSIHTRRRDAALKRQLTAHQGVN